MHYLSTLCKITLCGSMAFVIAGCGDPKPPGEIPWHVDVQGSRIVVESGPTYSKKTIWNDFASCFWADSCPAQYWIWKLRLIPQTPERAWQHNQRLYSAQFTEIEKFQLDGLEPPYSLRSLESSAAWLENDCREWAELCDEEYRESAREQAILKARYVSCAEAEMQQPHESDEQWHARLMKSQAEGVAYSAWYSISHSQASDENFDRRSASPHLRPILDDACPEGS